MNRTAQIDAKTARLEARLITLSARDRRVFVNALLKPDPLNKRLRKAAKRYSSLTGI